MSHAVQRDMPLILVTGGTGQVGFELRRELSTLGRVVAPSSAELDLGTDSIRSVVRALAPNVVVNAAAYTAVDRAELDVGRCEAVNAIAPGVLAEEVRRLRGLLVHFSTDYVFDGSETRPYLESDPTSPVSMYGRTKAEGERRIHEAGGDFLIFRTSWVYGLRGRNFLRAILDLAHTREELRVVADQTGSPTWSRMIATATAQVLAQVITPRNKWAGSNDRLGLYHMAAAGTTSWHEFASEILALDPARDKQRCSGAIPISTAEYPTPARRPLYSALNTSKLRAQFGVKLPHWRDQLSLAMSR